MPKNPPIMNAIPDLTALMEELEKLDPQADLEDDADGFDDGTMTFRVSKSVDRSTVEALLKRCSWVKHMNTAAIGESNHFRVLLSDQWRSFDTGARSEGMADA